MNSRSDVFEGYRPLLFSIAYRMLGSAMEAEDIVQEAYLRFQGIPSDQVDSPKAYLTTIVTRLCLDQLKSARAKREQYIGTWLPEPVRTGPSPSAIVGQRETISMAFLVLLESLSPVERAIFLLREVFDYSYAEIAKIVDKSEANCRQHYRRAQQYIVERRPRFEPLSGEQARLVEGFIQAVQNGDVDGMAQMLAEDAVLYSDGGGKAAAARHPVHSRAKVAKVVHGGLRNLPPDLRPEITEINGQISLLGWRDDQLIALMTFEIAGGVIIALRTVFNPDKLASLTPDHST